MQEQLELFPWLEKSSPQQSLAQQPKDKPSGKINRLEDLDKPFHSWYRFVLSFPPHLVRQYFDLFGIQLGQVILDPFCGTGTTVVEAKLNGIDGVGLEANPMAHFAAFVKSNWDIDGRQLKHNADRVAQLAEKKIRAVRKLRTLAAEQEALILQNCISPVPLHKALILKEAIEEECGDRYRGHALLALAKTVVSSASNLHFGPEVGVRGTKLDANVIGAWSDNVGAMAKDLIGKQENRVGKSSIHQADAREVSQVLKPESIDAVFTSPPYPNEKDYTRTTRLESVILGFINSKEDLRGLKAGLLRSNTRNVYKHDDDDKWVAEHPEINRLASEIEARRLALGKTSGFERLYARVTRLYFGGMARHLSDLRRALKSGARLGYVVGDQASYLRVMIRTGSLLAEIAQSLGYQVLGIDLFRTRLATATREQIREEVVLLRWPG